MAFDLALALKLGDFVSKAYDYSRNPAVLPALPGGYNFVHELYANDFTIALEDFRIFGFIAQSADDVVVAIRGTEGVFEWIGDFEFGLTTAHDAAWAGSTEQGFTNFYRSLAMEGSVSGQKVRDGLPELCVGGRTLHISGHSLGGALATLLAADVAGRPGIPDPTVYTFASPTVGDKIFAGTYDLRVPDSWRIANLNDIVTHLPPRFAGYVHVDAEFPINSDESTRHSVACWHSLLTYLHVLDPQQPLLPDCKRPGG